MIRRVLGLLGALVAYVCVGTVLAEAIVGVIALKSGAVTAQQLDAIRAVIAGLDIESLRAAAAERDRLRSVQPSLADLARARAEKSRDLEFREQALASALEQLKSERLKLAEESNRYKQVKSELDTQLSTLREETLAGSEDSAREIIETIKPAQAKEQLMRMIQDGQMPTAVKVLTAMPPTRRSKVLDQFKTPEEGQRLAEMLKMILGAEPELQAIDSAEKKLR